MTGCYSWSHLKEPVASWPAREKRQALFLRVELGIRESGGHSVDKTQNQGRGLEVGDWPVDIWMYSSERPDRMLHSLMFLKSRRRLMICSLFYVIGD